MPASAASRPRSSALRSRSSAWRPRSSAALRCVGLRRGGFGLRRGGFGLRRGGFGLRRGLAGRSRGRGLRPAVSALPATTATAAPATARAGGATALVAPERARRELLLVAAGAEALGHHLALVDPALDPDPAGGRLRLDEAVVDVGAQRVQRHAAVAVALGARHLGAAEAAGDLDLDPLGARAHRRGQGALHRAAEGDPVLELLGDRLRDQLRVELGALDLADVDLDRLLRDPVQLATQGVDLGAGLADHDPRPRGVDVDRDLAALLDDRDVGEAGVRELVLDVVADRQVLDQQVGEVALVEPVRLPVVDVADPEALGVDLLSHSLVPQSVVGVSATER